MAQDIFGQESLGADAFGTAPVPVPGTSNLPPNAVGAMGMVFTPPQAQQTPTSTTTTAQTPSVGDAVSGTMIGGVETSQPQPVASTPAASPTPAPTQNNTNVTAADFSELKADISNLNNAVKNGDTREHIRELKQKMKATYAT